MKNINILFILLLLSSCETKEKCLDEYFTDVVETSLVELKDFPSDSIKKPSHIYTFDNYIVLVEPKQDKLLTIYNLEDKSFRKVLNIGQGPDEIIDIQQIGAVEDETSFFVLGTHERKAFVYSKKDDFATIQTKLSDFKNSSTICFDENNIIVVQTGKNKRYLLKDKNNHDLAEFGEIIKIKDFSPEIISEVLGG